MGSASKSTSSLFSTWPGLLNEETGEMSWDDDEEEEGDLASDGDSWPTLTTTWAGEMGWECASTVYGNRKKCLD